METRTLILLLGVVGVLASLAAYGFLTPESGGLELMWISDTGRGEQANHHEVAAARVNGEALIAAPVSMSGGDGSPGNCALIALNGDGEIRWRHDVPPPRCYIHAVGDPAIEDFDADGTEEVLSATTENVFHVFSPSGELEFRYNLTSFGYGKPTAGNLTAEEGNETVVIDFRGVAFVFDSSGSLVWRKNLSTYALAQPRIGDFDADGEPEIVTGAGVMLENNGSVAWRRDVSGSYLIEGQMDSDDAQEIAFSGGKEITVVDGRNGDTEWQRRFRGSGGAVSLSDADSDGSPELYAGFGSTLYSLSAGNGSTVWSTVLVSGGVDRLPPPDVGDVDGDGGPEVVAAASNGLVSVVGAVSGEVDGSYRRDVGVYAHPTVSDVDGDGRDEVIVIYGDGRVVALGQD